MKDKQIGLKWKHKKGVERKNKHVDIVSAYSYGIIFTKNIYNVYNVLKKYLNTYNDCNLSLCNFLFNWQYIILMSDINLIVIHLYIIKHNTRILFKFLFAPASVLIFLYIAGYNAVFTFLHLELVHVRQLFSLTLE